MNSLKPFFIPIGLAVLTVFSFILLSIIAPNPNRDQGTAASFFFAILFGISATIYLIPAMISGFRSSPSFVLITILNILGGWTLLGWIGALIWALVDKKSEPTVIVQHHYHGTPPPPPLPTKSDAQ